MNDYSSYSDTGIAAAIMGMSLIYWVVLLVICILMIVAMWKIFEKAGEPGWKSLIPYYRAYVFFQITCGNGWLFLITLIFPFFYYWAWWKLCKAFDKGIGFFILLLFFTPIAFLILGFGDADYIGVQ